LDGASIQPGLLRGRVVMAWKQLRCLAQPNSAASPNDPLELELPLKVIAPLFLAGQKNAARNQAKTAVSAEIPDLFFGFPQPAPAAPAEAPLLPPLPKAPAPGAQDTNFFPAGDPGEFSPTAEAGQRRRAAQTDFLSRLAHPKDVVAAAMALPGVAGSVVAMQDGLRVASQVPAEFNADTLAAFLPQIVERVNQCTRELRMGALNNVNFTVGNVPWKIFRVNAVYFAAFGRVGEQLPSAQLAQLAAELERKK
jgi:predicted regulator of Ras-like GTPase activity (Roadblock/LC7/MglB family)